MISGHCLCGAISISIDGPHDPRVGVCHCRMCQRWSGGVNMGFGAEARAVTVSGRVSRYLSSSFAERAFCPVCGSHLWYRDVGEDGEPVPDEPYEFSPGLFDAARDWPLRSEIYIDRAFASGRLVGDHIRRTRAEVESKNRHLEGDMP